MPSIIASRFASSSRSPISQVGTLPFGRMSCAAAVVSNSVVLFGGVDGSGIVLSDLFTFSISGNKWTQVVPAGTALGAPFESPEPRSGATLVPFDPTHTPGASHTCVLLFGGQSQSGSVLSNLWIASMYKD